jgi:hypothetical protein
MSNSIFEQADSIIKNFLRLNDEIIIDLMAKYQIYKVSIYGKTPQISSKTFQSFNISFNGVSNGIVLYFDKDRSGHETVYVPFCILTLTDKKDIIEKFYNVQEDMFVQDPDDNTPGIKVLTISYREWDDV